MGPRCAVCLGAVLALAACGGEPMHAFFTSRARPLIFAHRGGGGLLPEETLPALLSAQANDPQAVIEFDVHGTADGHFVVFHDPTLDRTTDGTGEVSAHTVAELKLLDAGYCATPGVGNGTAEDGDCKGADPARFPFRGQGYQIATLDEVLAALPADTPASVELKQPGRERELADALRASGRMTHLITGAEWDDVAVRLKALLPELPHYYPTAAATCLALAAKAGGSYAACPHYEAFAAPLSGAGLALDTEGVLAAAHDDGVAVVYWTINDESEMARLFLLGADGLYTDYPDRARRVLDGLRAEGMLP
jgi:glycerophosphoryl diester phosphodiesterase